MLLKGIIIDKGFNSDNIQLDIEALSAPEKIYPLVGIPVLLGFDKSIKVGTADIFISEGFLKANIELTDDNYLQVKHLVPAVGASIIKTNDLLLEEVKLVKEMRVLSIGLGLQNKDNTIKSLFMQTINTKTQNY